jgi:tight adherence protein C
VKSFEFWFYYHLPQILTVFLGTLTCSAVYQAAQAWRDVVKLDAQEQILSRSLLDPLVRRYMPKGEIMVHALRMRLQQAGMRDDGAMARYVRWRVTGLAIAAVVNTVLILAQAKFTTWIVYGGASLFFGYFGPEGYIDRTRQARQLQISEALPSLMDLMVLCLDVGLSVESAFERVTQEMRSLHPLMAEESALMVREIGAGLTFPQALKRMAERIGVEDLLTLARLISQASQLGASVAQALREYSDASLNKRMLSLDEKAGKISSMMVLPITVCMLPAVMIALLGPAVLNLIDILTQV